ncbi:NADPH:quinone reductase-like Zn-dependent oxidoreductase [Pedobacter cryoconitis]|uniref:NADPH:quinone reductase-like Zn-dependent oxidoreductase n=1 Tax=Pedobacter cryoconitis TaxID=188932 RepID=A0A7W8YUK7_9SPHI|nr:NADP-dependent oxidoreductase [Pedobacter cryoconitis]MBB5622085.1 NADPH:quinone reductase-like Zn-dependent oxidoreductase [Pedobacter cryoconitis]
MKAILLKDFGSTDNFILENNYAIPEPGDRDILIKIKATAFNPIDYQMRQGKTEKKRMHSPILGREFSGVIVKVGKLTQRFKVGDAVFAASGSMGSNGTYTEYISVPELLLVHKPEQLTFEEAAAIPSASLTALQCYNRLGIQFTDSVFITGAAGGVGMALVKILIAKGYQKIIATAGNQESKSQLLKAGLKEEQLIDYKTAHLSQVIINHNKGHLFNHCIDLVGDQMSLICAQVIATNGTYADVTALTTGQAREELFHKGAVLVNISNYAYSLEKNYGYYGDSLSKFMQLMSALSLSPPAIKNVGLLSVETVKEAHQLLEDNQTKGRKLVMQIA